MSFGAQAQLDSPDGQNTALAAAAAALNSGNGSVNNSGICKGCGLRLSSRSSAAAAATGVAITVGGS